MRDYLIAIIIITAIITLLGGLWYLKMNRNEGFENENENPLGSIMSLIRRTSTRLLDIDMWKERILLSKMSPTELARYYMKTKVEDGKKN